MRTLPPLDNETLEQMKQPLRLELTMADGLALLATMQLALRHPKFKKTPTAASMDILARSIQKALSDRVPKIAMLCEAGWNERFDK